MFVCCLLDVSGGSQLHLLISFPWIPYNLAPEVCPSLPLPGEAPVSWGMSLISLVHPSFNSARWPWPAHPATPVGRASTRLSLQRHGGQHSEGRGLSDSRGFSMSTEGLGRRQRIFYEIPKACSL